MMNTSPGNFASGLFTFLAATTNRMSAVKEQLSCWVNGIAYPADLLDLYATNKEEGCRAVDGTSSFVLYDAKESRVLAVRDFFGVYPLFYTKIDNHLLVSFSIRAIIDARLFTPTINRFMIADYLNWDSVNKPITNQTFYKNIYSLLPGHMLVSENGQITIKPYGKLDLDKYASLTDEEYIRYFSDFFVWSVQKMTEPFTKIATHLSGGLDSSSVCSIAQSLSDTPVHSFYSQTDTPAAQEEVYVEAVLEKWVHENRPITHRHVQPDKDVYADVVKTTAQVGQPSQLLLPISTFLPIIEHARQTGCDVLLSGHGGDQVLGYGFEYLDELFQKQDWKTLKTAIANYADKRALQTLTTKSSFKTVSEKRRAYTLYFFARRLKQSKSIRLWKQCLIILITQFNCGLSDVFNWFYTRKRQAQEETVPALKNWLRDDWIDKSPDPTVSELDSAQLVSGVPSALQKEQIDFFYSRLGIQYNEEIDQLHACYSLKTGHPFLNKELLELTLNTSSRLRFGDGLGRSVLRKALATYLPEKVANRVDKGEFSEYAHQAFIAFHEEFIQQTDQNHPVWDIVDKKTFDDALGIIVNEQYTIKQKNPYRFVANRVIYLAIWLDYLKTSSF